MEVIAVILGFLLRIVLPLLGTIGLSILLRRLDERWRLEGIEESLRAREASEIRQVACWIVRSCPPERMANCRFRFDEQPCWEKRRVNGRLQKQCADCPVIPKALQPVGAAANS